MSDLISGPNSTMEPQWLRLCYGWLSTSGPKENYFCWRSAKTS